MKEKYTPEQKLAIESSGKVIVSASAGSGKTFVMIQKLADLIEKGADVDEILAVTFTKKAAAQMKDKLRSALIGRLQATDDDGRKRLKEQLNKINSADISTIHSFCSHLIRTYFYALDIDSTFDIMADDDADAAMLKNQTLNDLFEDLYESDNSNFLLVLKRLTVKRNDNSVKKLILKVYNNVRIYADYRRQLSSCGSIFTHEGFVSVCKEIKQRINEGLTLLLDSWKESVPNYHFSQKQEVIDKYCANVTYILQSAIDSPLFTPKVAFPTFRRPKLAEGEIGLLDEFDKFRKRVKAAYDKLYEDVGDEAEEEDKFIKSAPLACAFADVLLQFDERYLAIKRRENMLDYNDLEHMTLALLRDEQIKSRINAKYKYVYVDEYQDVNPLQETLIAAVGGQNVFTVGDVKQAIYGFRGSKSLFFANKYNRMQGGEGTALRLSSNFRSTDAVLNFVNQLFSRLMISSICGFDYKGQSEMVGGGYYPKDSGLVKIHVFGKAEKNKAEADGIYSVVEHTSKNDIYTREGLAVLKIVEEELKSTHYDLDKKQYVPTQTGDICILTRKKASSSTVGIVRALTDAGYPVAGVNSGLLLKKPEVAEMLDILSFIDNFQQDIPLVTCLLSPLCGLTRDELAHIRIDDNATCAANGIKEKRFFRECVLEYTKNHDDETAKKIVAFYNKINYYANLSKMLGASDLIDKILEDSGLLAVYSAGNGEKLLNIRRLADAAFGSNGQLCLYDFLNKIKAGGEKMDAPAKAVSDSIKVMTMHASKGLEFPVVIIADISATFEGDKDEDDILFDEQFGLSPRYYDDEKRLYSKTKLGQLVTIKSKREDLKNELNLFYVACTRAMCNLHIMCSSVPAYDKFAILNADCYSKMFDVNAFKPEDMGELSQLDIKNSGNENIISKDYDKQWYDKISSKFMQKYSYEESITLPVKRSASQLISMEEDDNSVDVMVAREEKIDAGQTGAERGTAYHRFLQLCNFALKDIPSIQSEMKDFLDGGLITKEQYNLLDAQSLSQILNMPAFAKLNGAKLYREREFMCRLPANKLLGAGTDDYVLVQGAIDLLAVGDFGTAIIDYKHSKKTDEQLKQHYGVQLNLYKQAVAAIMGIDEKTISTTIINIYLKRQIEL
jgi:ATP-dependent helicase/nuclease subunit A